MLWIKNFLLKLLQSVAFKLASNGDHLDEIAHGLAQIIPFYLQPPQAQTYFQFWEAHGFHVTPVHYYQPIPDTRTLTDDLWAKDTALAGINFNDQVQLDLLQNVFPTFQSEYEQFSINPTECPYEFYMSNEMFSGVDALVLYGMVRHFKPKLILEVGSGFSTRISARAALRNGHTQLVSIEPYPSQLLKDGFPGLTRLVPKAVQELGSDFFQQLGASDILFVDTSHVVKCGGDVNFLFLEVFPRLNPGVLVHIHDIFLPQEFPKAWMVREHLFFTEQYLLQAFLTFNSEFEVLFANAYLELKYPQAIQAAFPSSPRWSADGSFWMRRKLLC